MGGFHDLFSMRPPSLLVLLGWSTMSCVLCLLFYFIYLVVYLQFNLLISNLYFCIFCIFYLIYICILPHFQPPSQNTEALPPLTPTGSPRSRSICFVRLPYVYNTLFSCVALSWTTSPGRWRQYDPPKCQELLPVTQCHIEEDLNIQHGHCENLKSMNNYLYLSAV
jgi:hypothetical protein